MNKKQLEKRMDFFALVIVVSLISLAYYYARPRRYPKKLPPGPYPFPIVGNMFQLGERPNRSITKLAKTYGPLMSLRFGSLLTVVVSSPEMAREVLQKYDHVFSSRFVADAWEAFDHHTISVAFLPVGDRWRRMRKVFREVMLSTPRLDGSQDVRQKMIKSLYDYLHECSKSGKVMNIGEAAFITTINLTSVTMFSGEVVNFDVNATTKFKEIFMSLTSVSGKPNLSDYFPLLKPFDVQGLRHKMEFHFGQLLGMFDGIINERLKEMRRSPGSSKKNDMLDALLEFSEDKENELSMNDVKHLLLDLFVAGSDTTSSTTEWAVTELLLHPDKLAKAKQELKTVVGEKRQVLETDIPNLPYLDAVIKETYRLHPVGPFLIPRRIEEDAEVNGCFIPKGTQIFVNVWSIHRDKKIWPNPEAFEPERFLSSNIDYKGQDFELLPFGSGRRVCPGIPLAHRMLHMMVGTFIHQFDWKFEPGVTREQVDITEKFGLAMHKAIPLKAIPIKT
uniref:Cytochrome P450 76BK1 n=1 Tax=Petraeovitex bambusetorum TaxID=1932429 RepID=A0A9Y1LMF5_9LAMI|nr:cytochrome P450 76BK1 [Petraeovitex bambusetorum]